MRDNIFIIILNWNGWSDTKDCLKSIKNDNFIDYTIVLVDNGSESEVVIEMKNYIDANYDLVVEYSKEEAINGGKSDDEKLLKNKSGRNKIVFIDNNENLGFAKGNNVALKYVLSIGGKYAMLLNNDTELTDGALSSLFNYIKVNENCGAVIPQIRYYSPNDRIWNCGGRITWFGARKYYYFYEDIKKVPQTGWRKVDYGTGCALLMNLTITGILSEKYFFGEEDFEFSLRLKKKKLDLICLFDSVIFHKVGTSRKKVSEEKLGPMIYHYSMRLSDLKDYQNIVNWYCSVLAHIFSSFRLLKRTDLFSVGRFVKFWRIIFKVINSTPVFTRDIFINLSKQKI